MKFCAISSVAFGSGSIRLVLLCLGFAASLPAARPVSAQVTSTGTPSPAGPGDLSKPAFDTTTPIYDQVASLEKAAGTVVAEVEGRPITLGNVGDTIRALPASLSRLPFDALYPGILDQLIRQEALVVRAQQQGVDDEPAIRRRVKAAADRTLSEEYLREQISRTITEAALLDKYNKDVAGHPGEEEVRARVILAGSEKAAADLIAEVQGGADFAAVARRASKDTTAPVGGDLGFHSREGMNPEVGAVAFALRAGEMAAFPVRTGAGWFVIRVEERRQQSAPAFASVREQLRQSLIEDGAAAVTAAAVKDLHVRRYSFTGQEITADKATGQALPPD